MLRTAITAAILFVLQQCVMLKGQSAPGSAFDLELLAPVCRSQKIIDQCSPDAVFCSSNTKCPQRQFCSCTQNCGNLTCVLPDNVKVCGCHPLPRDGFVLQRADHLEFFCDIGFRLTGIARKDCVDGEWLPKEFPQCAVVQCGDLPALQNGRILLDSVRKEYGTTASFKCNSGYTLVGQTSTQCREDGQWSGQQPSCARDGALADWQAWQDCDAQCSTGLQRRTRVCTPPEEGGKPCAEAKQTEVRICDTGKRCETNRLSCHSSAPWKDQPVIFKFDHPALTGTVHRCLHHCKQRVKNYGAVEGAQGCWCFDSYKTNTIVDCSSPKSLFELYAAPQGARCTKQAVVPVSYTATYTEYFDQRYTTSCGGWGWSRCTRFRKRTRPATRTLYKTKLIVTEC